MAPGRRVAALALALTAGVAGVSCGGEPDSPQGPEGELARTLADAQQAFADGDRTAACAALTARARRQIGAAGHGPPKPCVANIGMFIDAVRRTGDRRGAEAPTVESVDVARGIALVRFGKGVEGRIPVVREGGRWRLGEFFGFSPRSRLSR